jgi:MerR family mercuric resistance operon transcriptional regulator
MRRGELAAATGANPETVRFYEKIGLLPAPPRSEGGHRVYGQDHARRLSFVLRGRGLGFSVDEIRGLLNLVDTNSVTCDEVRQVTLRHLKEVRQKIRALKKLEKVLAETASKCTGTDAPDCPVIDALAGEMPR